MQHIKKDGRLDSDISCILDEVDEITWRNHKEKPTFAFGADIINVLQEEVQKLTKENWKDDECPPEFWCH